MLSLQFKSMSHMNFDELMATIQQLEKEAKPLGFNMYADIVSWLGIFNAPRISINLFETDVPGYTPSYTPGCPAAFTLPNTIILNLANIHELAHHNATLIKLNDMRKAFTAELAHQIMLNLAKAFINCYDSPAMANSYNWLGENQVWNVWVPQIQRELKKKYYVDFQTQVLDTIAGRQYSLRYSPISDLDRLYYMIASVIDHTQDEWSPPILDMVMQFRKATRFMLNLKFNNENYPGIILVDNGHPIDDNINRTFFLTQELNKYFKAGYRINFYGDYNQDCTVSLNFFSGYRSPFIPAPQ